MYFIDTHTHLYDDEGLNLVDEHIHNAIEQNVQKMYMPNCDSTTIKPMLDIYDRFPQHCFPMIGLHPCYVKENYKNELHIVLEYIEKYRFWGIGEVGLDFYWDRTFIKEQKEAFELQIEIAKEHELPVIIHSRSSTKECIDIIKRKQNGKLIPLFHCYSGTLDEAREIIDLGGYLGIGGVVTYKKSTLPEILAHIPIKNIVLETDAPYLAPIPYRGKRNKSTYIPIIAEKLAQIYNISVENIAKETSLNAQTIFSIKEE